MTAGRSEPKRLLLLAAGLLCATTAHGQPRFVEVSEPWGLDFRHHTGASGRRFFVETTAGGVLLFDYDGDGDADVFFVDGGHLPGYSGEPATSRLFRNEGGGRFLDVSGSSRISLPSYGSGGAAGDVDGDGDSDLYLTAFGANRLFENLGDGTFRDVTADSGAGDDRWSSSATFADFDRDGDLDLYVANYIQYELDTAPVCRDPESGVPAHCHPSLFEGAADRYLRNRGDGVFDDATLEVGLSAASGNGLGVVAADLDDDGWTDLYVANDTTPNFLFLNRHGLFEDQSILSGTAYGDRFEAEAGMGIAVADFDGNGLLDLYVTNFALETNALYHNLGGGLFADRRHPSGVAEPSIPVLGFGTQAADFDRDGDPDLVVANGHILDNVEELRPGLTYAQPNQLLLNDGSGRFATCLDCGLDSLRVSRALATGDLDLDGDLDFVVVNSDDSAEAWENRGPFAGGWFALDLGQSGGAGTGIGAKVEVAVGGRTLVQQAATAASFQSQNASSLFFGVGDADRVDTVRVRWPDGRMQSLSAVAVNRRLRLAPPQPAPPPGDASPPARPPAAGGRRPAS